MSESSLTGSELKSLLEKRASEVHDLLDEIHPEDLADVVDKLEDNQAGQVLMQLPTEFAAQVFERLDEDRQEALAKTLGVDSTAELALEMDTDDLADFIEVVPPAVRTSLLTKLRNADPEVAEELQELRKWPDTSAGGLMTTDYIAIGPNLSVREAIEAVREHAEEAETLDCLYVTNEADWRLLGLLTMRRMLLAGPDERVSDVMLHGFKSVPPEMDQEDVARVLAKYDLTALPVVAENEELLGVITADDVLDVLTEEQNEDLHKMGAVEPIRDGYFDTSFAVFIRKRIPWLLILFLGGFLATQTMQTFERELGIVTQLAFYLPLLISAGGNSGSQSSTLIIRGLAVGDITVSDWGRVLGRELLQGLVLGGILAAFGIARAVLAGDGLDFAVLVGSTVVAIVVIGCVVGAMAPLLLHQARVDPATSSTPFIATLVDVLGILVYLTLARWLLEALQSVAPA